MHAEVYNPEPIGTMVNAELQMVRAGFIARGTTLTAWCRREGLQLTYVRQCISGHRAGPKARAIATRVRAAAGLPPAPEVPSIGAGTP